MLMKLSNENLDRIYCFMEESPLKSDKLSFFKTSQFGAFSMSGPSLSAENLESTLRQVLENQLTFKNDLINLTTVVQNLKTQNNNLTGSSSANNTTINDTTRNQTLSPSSMKLEIPKFDGTDPLGWIFRIKQFFDFHNTPEDQRLRIASFYLEGEVLSWFQWMHSNGQIPSWPVFLQALEIRFASSQFEDPLGALCKLCQTASVREYQNQFENLANKVIGLPSKFFLSCFISGLKRELRREVQAFQPISLQRAISLAKLHEDKLNDSSNKPRKSDHQFSEQPTSSENPIYPKNFQRPPAIITSTKPPITTTPSSASSNNPTVKRMTASDVQTKREKGLCYRCDEKYHPEHRCKRQYFVFLADESMEVSDQTLTQLLIEDAAAHQPEPETEGNADPAPGQESLKKEQEEKEHKKKKKAEAHLYTIIKVARDEDLQDQIGKEIYFDLVDHDKVRSFRVQKQRPFKLFKEEVAKEFGIPVQFQRFWLWAKRQNHTYRPHRPLTHLEETRSVGQLREVSKKVHNAELKLFLEVQLGLDLRPIAPPDKTKDDILLFFKLYDPKKEELRYVGRLFVKSTGNPKEILTRLNELAGYDPEEEIALFEEIKFEANIMCEPIDKKLTFRASELEDGDIVCFQKASSMEIDDQIRYPDVPSYLEYVYNRQVVHFRSLRNIKEMTSARITRFENSESCISSCY